jgi:hypothetical protein
LLVIVLNVGATARGVVLAEGVVDLGHRYAVTSLGGNLNLVRRHLTAEDVHVRHPWRQLELWRDGPLQQAPERHR